MSEAATYDVVVLGSGVAGLSAALAAAEAGLKPLLIEKGPALGGCTVQSYGLFWVGDNYLMRQEGISDSRGETMRYLRFLSGGETVEARVDAFVDNVSTALEFFRDCGIPFRISRKLTDHYYGAAQGAKPEGRSLETDLISGFELGEWQHKIFKPADVPTFVTVEEQTAWGGINRVGAWDQNVVAQRKKDDIRGKGYGAVTHFVKALLKRGVPIWLDRNVDRLVTEKGAVTGVEVDGVGFIRADKGVVLATGGYDYNIELACRLEGFPKMVPMTPTSLMGDGLALASEIGGIIHVVHNSLFIMLGYPTPMEHAEGAASCRAGVAELISPHTMLVNRSGKRFADESFFQGIVPRLRDFDVKTHEMTNIPCFLIFDQQYPDNFSFAHRPAGSPVPDTVARADTLEELAAKLEIDASALVATVARFNEYARDGVDRDFHRGEGHWKVMTAHSTALKNQSLGTIEKPPFYGVALYPSVGNSAGVVADEHGRAVHQRGHPIPGLYVSGVVGAKTEIGAGYQAGLNLASALTFSHRAVRHMTAAGG